jgi:nucleoside-diphosphate-sugar epimerase
VTVLVTGGAGFIGSHIVAELMRQRTSVRVLDNFSEGRIENIRQFVDHPNFQLIRGDVRDFDLVRRAADGCYGILHLAACSRIQPSITDPMIAFTANFMGTSNVAEAARLGGVKRVVYSASSSAYGRRNDECCEPIEDYDGDMVIKRKPLGLVEECPTECLNPYSLSKKVGEEIMDLYNRLYGLSTCSLRYFNVYGPRHQESGAYATVIAIFRRQLRHGKTLTVVGDGEQRRDFTYVDDVVRANLMALYNQSAVGLYNIGAGQNYSINEVASLVKASYTGRVSPESVVEYIPPRLGEARVTLANTGKAQRDLGWKAQVDFKTGLKFLDDYEKVESPSGLIVAL